MLIHGHDDLADRAEILLLASLGYGEDLLLGVVDDIARQSKALAGEFERAAVLDRRDGDRSGHCRFAVDSKGTAVDDRPGVEGCTLNQPCYGRIIDVGDSDEAGGVVRDGSGGLDDPGGDSAIVCDVAHSEPAGDD